MKKLLLCTVLLLVSQTFIYAQKVNSFSPKIKRVAVFKNGYAFTYREGETSIKNGWAYSTNAPTGVLGTIWGYSTSPNVKVTQLLTTEIEKREMVRVTNLSEVLIANEGAKIRFVDISNKRKNYEGTYEILSKNSSPTIILKTESGVMFFPYSSIKDLEILQTPKLSKPRTSTENRLKMKVKGIKDGKKVNLGLAALERGIRWIPAYRIEVKGNPVNEVKLELEAMLINELDDLQDSEVFFVVGVPHFLFKESISPLSMNTAFTAVSSYFKPQSTGRTIGSNVVSNAIMTQVTTTNGNQDLSLGWGGLSSNAEQSNSFSAEELYLYQANQINLKKNERASLKLYSINVPASEVFEWTLNDLPNTQSRYLNSGRNSSYLPIVQHLADKVWFGLRLKNNTGMPWTTAPALSFKDWKPLGQDLLTFTPIGGENILRISPATEVIGTHTLKEIAREQTTLVYNNRQEKFDLVTVEGTIKIRNAKKESVELVLKRKLVGEMISASDNGEFSKEGLNLRTVNPTSRIKWNLTVPKGSKEIKYAYKIYIRR